MNDSLRGRLDGDGGEQRSFVVDQRSLAEIFDKPLRFSFCALDEDRKRAQGYVTLEGMELAHEIRVLEPRTGFDELGNIEHGPKGLAFVAIDIVIPDGRHRALLLVLENITAHLVAETQIALEGSVAQDVAERVGRKRQGAGGQIYIGGAIGVEAPVNIELYAIPIFEAHKPASGGVGGGHFFAPAEVVAEGAGPKMIGRATDVGVERPLRHDVILVVDAFGKPNIPVVVVTAEHVQEELGLGVAVGGFRSFAVGMNRGNIIDLAITYGLHLRVHKCDP